MVVDAYEWAGEGEYLTKGNEYAVVDFAQGRANEARYEQYTAKYAQTYS